MKLNEILGFEVFDWGKWKALIIDSDRIDLCMEYYFSNNLDGVFLSSFHGYKLREIKFLKDYPSVGGIVILDGDKIDISGIEYLRELRYFSIEDNKQPIDFSVFPELEEIRVDWHPKMKITEQCRKLKHVCLWKYKPKSKTLSELPYLESLEFLGIVQSTIRSSEGVGRFKKLKELELSYNTKLEILCDMEKLPLELLDIDVCRKIRNHEHTSNTKTLKILRLNDCGEMPSISFIRELPNLKQFNFVGTDVLDGDMTPCLDLDLEFAGFTSKRHFSHSMKEINEMLKSSEG